MNSSAGLCFPPRQFIQNKTADLKNCQSKFHNPTLLAISLSQTQMIPLIPFQDSFLYQYINRIERDISLCSLECILVNKLTFAVNRR